jgi:hypothetical protein
MGGAGSTRLAHQSVSQARAALGDLPKTLLAVTPLLLVDSAFLAANMGLRVSAGWSAQEVPVAAADGEQDA